MEAHDRFAALLLHAWLVAVAVDCCCCRYCPLPLVLTALGLLALLVVLLQLALLLLPVVLLQLVLLVLLLLLLVLLLLRVFEMVVSLEVEQLAPLVADEVVDQTKALLALLQAAPRMGERQMCPPVLLASRQVRHLHRQSQSP